MVASLLLMVMLKHLARRYNPRQYPHLPHHRPLLPRCPHHQHHLRHLHRWSSPRHLKTILIHTHSHLGTPRAPTSFDNGGQVYQTSLESAVQLFSSPPTTKQLIGRVSSSRSIISAYPLTTQSGKTNPTQATSRLRMENSGTGGKGRRRPRISKMML